MLEYMVSRASEPCGKTVLPGIQTTLFFFEKGGGVRQQDMLAKDPLVENLIEGLQEGILKGCPVAAAAPREPIMFSVIRERIVLDESRPLSSGVRLVEVRSVMGVSEIFGPRRLGTCLPSNEQWLAAGRVKQDQDYGAGQEGGLPSLRGGGRLLSGSS